MREVTKADFDQEVLQSTETVVVDFWAPWCGPCRMLAPVLEQVQDKAKIVKVNVDNEPELAVQYNISSIPTVLVFKDGKLLEQRVGVLTKTTLEQLIENAKA